MRAFLAVFLIALMLLPVSGYAATYYVDATGGNDANSCSQALNPSTPKRTVNSIMSCNPGPGDTVLFRGNFSQTISPSRSGSVIYNIQNIAKVENSVVTFNTEITGLDPYTDYVTVYGSRKGNSGAFAVVSFSGNTVAVNTSDLPGGLFLQETEADPGTLQAAILRPVHFTAWDKQYPPIFNTPYQTFYSNGKSVVMVSYLHSISGEDYQVWPAIELDSPDLTDSDYIILDHLEVENAATAIAVESRHFQSNYDIIQHNNIHDIGYQGGASDEAIYFGYDIRQPIKYHDYVQIVYNKIGPHRFTTNIIGDGIEIKESARYATVFGNEVFGIQSLGCADAPIRISGIDAFVANNFVHDIGPGENRGCGISIIDDYPSEPTTGAKRAIVVNNILANVRGVGIRILDANGVQILHNTIYNIIYPEPNGDPDWIEEYAGIFVQNWQGPTENITIKNNIVHSANIGIGRYRWSNDYPVSIDSDYNLVFNTTYPFRGSITKNTHDLLLDPEFVDLSNNDYHLRSSSPAIDNGTALSDVAIDFDSISRPQGAGYDIGAYEFSALPNCTENDWNYSDGPCQPDNTSVRIWTKTGSCEGGITHHSNETIPCVYNQTLPGDINNDGDVDIADLLIIAMHFGERNVHPQWNATADVMANNEIDIYDVVFVASRFT